MSHFRTQILLGVVCLLLIPAVGRAGNAPALLFDVPRLNKITIDGKADDWGDQGFRVDLMADDKGVVKALADFNPVMRLGWDERGLLMLLTVTDDVPLESQMEDIWARDSAEVFLATRRGSNERYQTVFSPGVDPETPELRQIFVDHRSSPELQKVKLAATSARTKTEHGYVLEALWPWANLGLEPAEGLELAFQIYVNDVDQPGEKKFQALFYPQLEAHHNSYKMHRLRLAAKASPPVRAVAFGENDAAGQPFVRVTAVAELAGKPLTVKDGDKVLATGKLSADAGRATAKLTLPNPSEKPFGTLRVFIGDEEISSILPPPAK